MSDSNLGPVYDYWLDAWQRSILLLDVLRQRGNDFREKSNQQAPNVLNFDAELILDGRNLERPVCYGLVRILPSEGTVIDPTKRPFVVIDPRAGHGPGIGGMKHDSEIGLALAAGHPCYFIGFLPEPMPGQTIEDVWNAEAVFVAEVARLHPKADGKPAVIANCQAGWQTAIMAATHPDLPGPLMLVGSPMSYWQGVHGKNPMRYLGGLLGGTWLTSMAGDLGKGIFDGASLVANFESHNLANTFWKKLHNVYANVDIEAERFLEFERWWGAPVLLNAGEMQWIADNLFVGNKLTRSELRTSEGLEIDLKNIRSPIICFCSWGDDISPPQQCLHWIADLYSDDRQIIANGQTIVYTMHDSIGHLGIFVSGKVATKEHGEFINCMDMIDLLPPGLYEAVIEEVPEDACNPELIQGRYLMSLQPRRLADIRALGENSLLDDMRFETARRVSEINRKLYDMYVGPLTRGLATEESAEFLRVIHPNRLRFGAFCDANPSMGVVKATAEAVRAHRRPTAPDNPLLAVEEAVSKGIAMSLAGAGAARDMASEQIFLLTYGSPALHAIVGLDKDDVSKEMQVRRNLLREQEQAKKRTELDMKFEKGGVVEAVIRAICYILRGEQGVDERSYAVLSALRETHPVGRPRPMAELKATFHEQFLLVLTDEERAIETLVFLLPKAADDRQKALRAVNRMVFAQGRLSPAGKRRLRRIGALLENGSKDGAKKRSAKRVPADASA